MEGMALCVIYIGVSGSLKGQNTLTAIISIAIGAIIGELLDLDRRMRTLGDWVQEKTARLIHTREGAPSVADGFVTASLLFCVGAMAIVGSLENGLTGNYDTLKAKSVIDGIGRHCVCLLFGRWRGVFCRSHLSLSGSDLSGGGPAVPPAQ